MTTQNQDPRPFDIQMSACDGWDEGAAVFLEVCLTRLQGHDTPSGADRDFAKEELAYERGDRGWGSENSSADFVLPMTDAEFFQSVFDFGHRDWGWFPKHGAGQWERVWRIQLVRA